MYRIIILGALFISKVVISADVEEKIIQYFKGDILKTYQKHWQAHRRSFEDAIENALKENYGLQGMNVFVRRSADGLRISKGFYVSDNVVNVLFMDLTLTDLPQLLRPDVTFALASNVFRLESGLSKMIIECNYLMFRNQSDIVFDASDTNKHSPFSLQQTQRTGRLAIIADLCSLDGSGLIKLIGQTVNLGHDTLSVRNCKFSVEISSTRLGTPPVIAPYFSPEQAATLEGMLTRPVREEMLPKLQSTIFTILNTSIIFDDYLAKFKKYQDNTFKEAGQYVSKIVKIINTETVKADQDAIKMPSIRSYCKTMCQGGPCFDYVVLENVTVYGLDSLYSSHTGGPFKLQEPKIAEALRFHSLLVRGSMHYENNTVQAEHDFVAEIHDMAVNFEIGAESKQPTFDVLRWRSIDFSIIELEHYLRDRRAATALVYGYLSNELPKVLKDHLINMYDNGRQQDVKLSTDEKPLCITEKT